MLLSKISRKRTDYPTEIQLLCKIGDRIHIEQLQRKGVIHAKPIQYFKTVKNSSRGDGNENITSYLQIGDFELTLNGRKLKDFAGPLSAYLRQEDQFGITHVFCMYGKYSHESEMHDKRISEFGDTILQLKPKPFVEKVVGFLNKEYSSLGITKYGYGVIHYVPYTYSGDMDIFTKLDNYAWQKEFRFGFACEAKKDIPLEFSVGDLSDISEINDTKYYNFMPSCRE